MKEYYTKYISFEHFVQKNLNYNDQKLYIHGCATLFNVVDLHNECIVYGAFNNSLNNVDDVEMKYEHKKNINGKWLEIKAEQDSNRLIVKGYITICEENEDLINSIKQGKIRGLSVGGYYQKTDYNLIDNIRYYHKLILAEISLVEQPANLWANFMPYIQLDCKIINQIKGNFINE